MKTLLILGGYGGTGRYISRRLLQSTNSRLVVAGRRLEKAVLLAEELNGLLPGRPLSVTVVLRHSDPYEFTAITVAACLRQYLDGSIARPGLWLMGEAVEPARLLQDMEHMGVHREAAVTPVAPGGVCSANEKALNGIR